MEKVVFYRCIHCGNIVGMVNSSGVNVVCCGENMTALVPNTTDASTEKHVPVVEVKDGTVSVKVGSAEHPMTEEHYIQWICLVTDKGVYRRNLKPLSKPEVQFALKDEKPLEVYAYCNLHGLWKADC